MGCTLAIHITQLPHCLQILIGLCCPHPCCWSSRVSTRSGILPLFVIAFIVRMIIELGSYLAMRCQVILQLVWEPDPARYSPLCRDSLCGHPLWPLQIDQIGLKDWREPAAKVAETEKQRDCRMKQARLGGTDIGTSSIKCR